MDPIEHLRNVLGHSATNRPAVGMQKDTTDGIAELRMTLHDTAANQRRRREVDNASPLAKSFKPHCFYE